VGSLDPVQLVSLSLTAGGGTIEASFNPLGARQVALKHNGRNALQPYDLSKTPPFATGFVMAPWANRMRDGRWVDSSGVVHANPINEERTQTALHGLLMDTVYEVTEQTETQVTFTATLNSTDGYPFEVTTYISYRLVESGLEVTQGAINHSAAPAPYQTGAHPYPFIDGLKTGDLEILVPATHWWQVDDRLLPIGVAPVEGTALDARDWRRLSGFCIDNGFLNLARDADGLFRTTLRAPGESGDPRRVVIWQDVNFPQVHVFSTPIYPVAGQPDQVVHGITVEPVTAGPDAFNTGVDLIWLSPEQPWEARWGIQLLDW
jgi:aldose 1-epimerase